MAAFYVSSFVGCLAADQLGYEISLPSSIWYPCIMLKILYVGCVVAINLDMMLVHPPSIWYLLVQGPIVTSSLPFCEELYKKERG